jgi:Bor protein
MPRLRRLMTIGALVMLAGCHNVTYVAKTRTPSEAVHEEKMNFFVVGLVGTHDVQAGDRCPTGVARVKTTQTFVDVMLTIVTVGIYAPRTAQITCAQ